MGALTLAQLTENKLDGTGAFDVLVQTISLHLDKQFNQNRITGTEYAQVYLGQLNAAMDTALNFLVQSQRIGLEAELLQKQIELATKQVQIAEAQLLQTAAQTALIEKQAQNLPAEKAVLEANAAKIIAETALIPKQALQIEAQTALIAQQKLNSIAEGAKLNAEALNVPKQGLLLDAQLITATQQGINSEVEKRVLEGQVCKLQAEFDYTQQNTLKAASEVTLLVQKNLTEKAQIQNMGVDDNSVLGKQKLLYQAQTDGFKRDAEQKAARLYVDVWSAQRMTDPDATPASAEHGLSPAIMGSVMTKLRAGIGA